MNCNFTIYCEVIDKIQNYLDESKDTMSFSFDNNTNYFNIGKKFATLLSPVEQIDKVRYFMSYLFFLNRFVVCVKSTTSSDNSNIDIGKLFDKLLQFIEFTGDENKDEFLSRLEEFINYSISIFQKYPNCLDSEKQTESYTGFFGKIKLGILGSIRLFKGYLPEEYVSLIEFLKYAGETICSTSEILRLEKIHIWLKTVLQIGVGYQTALRLMSEYIHAYCQYFNKHGMALGAAKFIIDKKVYSIKNINKINVAVEELSQANDHLSQNFTVQRNNIFIKRREQTIDKITKELTHLSISPFSEISEEDRINILEQMERIRFDESKRLAIKLDKIDESTTNYALKLVSILPPQITVILSPPVQYIINNMNATDKLNQQQKLYYSSILTSIYAPTNITNIPRNLTVVSKNFTRLFVNDTTEIPVYKSMRFRLNPATSLFYVAALSAISRDDILNGITNIEGKETFVTSGETFIEAKFSDYSDLI